MVGINIKDKIGSLKFTANRITISMHVIQKTSPYFGKLGMEFIFAQRFIRDLLKIPRRVEISNESE